MMQVLAYPTKDEVKARQVEEKRATKQRLVSDVEGLNIKLAGVLLFTKSSRFLALSLPERDLLQEQCRVMTRYISILDQRIELF